MAQTVKESACNSGDLGSGELGSVPGLGRSPGEGNGYPLQYSGLENSMNRGAWQATVHGAAESRSWLRDFHFLKSQVLLFLLASAVISHSMKLLLERLACFIHLKSWSICQSIYPSILHLFRQQRKSWSIHNMARTAADTGDAKIRSQCSWSRIKL